MSNRTVHPLRFQVFCAVCALLLSSNPSALWADTPAQAGTLAWESYTAAQGLPSDRVSCLAENTQRIFIGTDKGLAVLEKSDKSIKVFSTADGLPHAQVLSVLADGETVWIGTEKGLAFWSGGKVAPAEPRALTYRINTMLKQDLELLLGTEQGVIAYRPAQKLYRPLEGLKDMPISALTVDDVGLLIGLSNGVVRAYNLKTGTAEDLDFPFNPLQNKVKFFSSEGDFVWFVIDGAGVVQYNKVTKSWSELSRTSATGKFLGGLAPDGRYLWIASFFGLHRYDLLTQTWEEYEDKSLTEHELTALAVFGEWITVGTDGGGGGPQQQAFPAYRSVLQPPFVS